jgi:DNA topoisomerase-1
MNFQSRKNYCYFCCIKFYGKNFFAIFLLYDTIAKYIKIKNLIGKVFVMKLVIVESPAKSKTIVKYLGSDYKVLPSIGHVRDLKAKDGSVDTEHDFSFTWEIMAGKEKQIREIEAAVKKADEVYLATDPDREGEAISWHLKEILGERKISTENFKRVLFHEITKNAIVEAIKNPRTIDEPLVDAYLARRALDYLVGFNISPVLWSKLPGSKSAGRVQSTALRLLCEREDEIEKFSAAEYWSIDGTFTTKTNENFDAHLIAYNGDKVEKFSYKNEADASIVLSDLENKKYSVVAIEKKTSQRKPVAPFTTSTLQQEASRKLRFSAKQTMSTAQKLYEEGFITYMRTDAVNLSDDAIKVIRELISRDYGEKYLPSAAISYVNKSKNAQEAHEAIRPTDAMKLPSDISFSSTDGAKLYELIWKRTVACQMTNAIVNGVAVDIESDDNKATFRANGSMIAFDGFLKLYREDTDDASEKAAVKKSAIDGDDVNDTDKKSSDDDNKMLPIMNEHDALTTSAMTKEQHFTQPPARYSEASLVKALEERGIGRPSTYANILSVIQDRNYVRLDKRKFVCEERGRIVTAFLKSYFTKYVEYDFTAFMEDELDEIANGKIDYKKVLHEFWNPFSASVAEAKNIVPDDVSEKLTADLAFHFFKKDGDDECPECHQGKLHLKVGKFGGFLGCKRYPDCRYTRQLAIEPADSFVDAQNAKTDDVIVLGADKNGVEITRRNGPYGPYVQLGVIEKGSKAKPARSSIPKGIDPSTIDLKKAQFLLALPKKIGKDADGIDIEIGYGKFGAYIKKETKYASLPAEKLQDFFNIKIADAVEILNTSKKSSDTSGGAKSSRFQKAVGENIGKFADTGDDIMLFKTGRYGPYFQMGKSFYSLNAEAKKIMESGAVIPIELVNEIIKKKLAK